MTLSVIYHFAVFPILQSGEPVISNPVIGYDTSSVPILWLVLPSQSQSCDWLPRRSQSCDWLLRQSQSCDWLPCHSQSCDRLQARSSWPLLRTVVLLRKLAHFIELTVNCCFQKFPIHQMGKPVIHNPVNRQSQFCDRLPCRSQSCDSATSSVPIL